MNSPHRYLAPPVTGGLVLQISLVTVVLVLFLSAYASPPPYCFRGVPVDLPFVSGAPFFTESDRDIPVAVHRDGAIYIDTKLYPAIEFRDRLFELGTRSLNHRVVIRADRSLPFTAVRAVLRSVRDAGYTNVVLLTFQGVPIQLLRKTAA